MSEMNIGVMFLAYEALRSLMLEEYPGDDIADMVETYGAPGLDVGAVRRVEAWRKAGAR